MFPPAICDSCGAVFQQRALQIDNSTKIRLQGVRVGPCPKCGGTGHIPDGVYDVIGNVIKVFSSTPRSSAELARIADIFRRAKERKASREEVAAEIRSNAPELSSLADLLPQNRSDLYAFIQVLLAIVTIYVTLKSSTPSITVNQVINQITIQAEQPKPAAKSPVDSRPKKYKKKKRRTKKGERQGKS